MVRAARTQNTVSRIERRLVGAIVHREATLPPRHVERFAQSSTYVRCLCPFAGHHLDTRAGAGSRILLGRMGSFVLGCMALGYMVLPLLPNRQLQLEGDGLRLLAQRHEDPRAVQAESGMDTVEVDLALAQDADRAEINAEADFMFREVDVNGDGETAAYLSLTQILIQTQTLTLTRNPGSRPGKISQQELHEYLGSAGYSVEQTTRIFEALDVNSDESITQEELRVGFARYEFSALRLAFGLAGELVSYSTTALALA